MGGHRRAPTPSGSRRPPRDALSPSLQNRVIALGRDAAEGAVMSAQIPALRNQDRYKFGAAVAAHGEDIVCFGDAFELFSLQSITKVFALSALLPLDPDAWSLIGWRPSPDHHDSAAGLIRESRPANPFVNAGAICVTDRLHMRSGEAVTAVRGLLEAQNGSHSWPVDERVSASEAATAHRNRAIAHLLADIGLLHGTPEAVLHQYFRQCAIQGTVSDLAEASLFLADASDQAGSLPRVERRRINSALLMSGTYGAAADVSFRIGLPAKSAISGAILAIAPGQGTIVVWSPPLDPDGNSPGALVALEALADALGWSIF